jgi:hypothetical protein
MLPSAAFGLWLEQLARELRSKTTLPLAWICACLNLGSRGHLGQSARGQAHSKTLARSSMP